MPVKYKGILKIIFHIYTRLQLFSYLCRVAYFLSSPRGRPCWAVTSYRT